MSGRIEIHFVNENSDDEFGPYVWKLRMALECALYGQN